MADASDNNSEKKLSVDSRDLPENKIVDDDIEQGFKDEILMSESKDYDKNLFVVEDDIALLSGVSGVYQLWGNWAYFELIINSPIIDELVPAVIIEPAIVDNDTFEFVYPIVDFGNKLITSKGEDMYSVGTSMCKLYYTIEKMIGILMDRVKSSGGGNEELKEVLVEFDGNQLAQRKAFESIINLNHNVVVSNFDPGTWGEKYLATIKRLADKGYGYPSEAPRDIYKMTGKYVSGKSGRI
jgi:hypothetical protein